MIQGHQDEQFNYGEAITSALQEETGGFIEAYEGEDARKLYEFADSMLNISV